jgi:hypothetical protein
MPRRQLWRDLLPDGLEHTAKDAEPSAVWRWQRVSELPDRLDAHTLYVIGEGNHRWMAALDCPCGCGAVVLLSLAKERRPRWTVVQHRNGTVTLFPSVRRTTGCHSHFIVADGKLFLLWDSSYRQSMSN